nr:phospholipase-like protein [Tanacetum cinerariifolium]
MAQNIDFSESDQIQTLQYPDVHLPSQEMNEEIFQAEGELMKSIQTFLETLIYMPFEENPKILFQAWEKKFAIQYSKPEDPNELFQKLLGDLKELAEYENSHSRDRPIFLNDDEDHSDQNKESLENSYKEIATSNSNPEKEKPSQDSDIRQLIREECCVEASEEQKQSMKDTMLEVVKICRQKELLCIHDNVDDLIESALNSKLLSINSQRLEKEKQEVKEVVEQPVERKTHIEKSLQNFRVIHKSSISLKNSSQISPVHAITPILSTKEPEYSPSIGYENSNTTLETESDEIIKSGVEELVPILSENEVTLEDKRECDVLVCENTPVCDDHSEIFSDSNNDDDISVYDDDFEDIEYVEASLPDPEIVSVEEENVVHREEEEVDLEDIFQIQDVDLHEKLLSITQTRSGITTTHANDSLPEYDSFCFEIEPDQERLINVGIKNVANDSKGDIRFLEELLIDDSILSHESSDSNFEDNPSVPLPPPEPPDEEFDFGDEISVVIDKLECIDAKVKFENDNYFSFMFAKVLISKTNGVLVDKLEFSEEFPNLSTDFYDELNKEFVKLFESPSTSSGSACSDFDIKEDADEDLDLYLGKPGMLRCRFPWCKDRMVDRQFWECLVCLDPPTKGWLLYDVFIPLNEPGEHWNLVTFDICSGLVKFMIVVTLTPLSVVIGISGQKLFI